MLERRSEFFPFAGLTSEWSSHADPVRPTSLILPYDDSFFPETGLPGIGIDIALMSSTTGPTPSQQSTLWSSSPAVSQSSASRVGDVRLELPSDDFIRDAPYAGDDSDVGASAQKAGLFGRKKQADLEEEGVLLHPDFEFDDLGNIVEFDASHLSPRKRRRTSASPHGSEGFVRKRFNESAVSASRRGEQTYCSGTEEHLPGRGTTPRDHNIRLGR